MIRLLFVPIFLFGTAFAQTFSVGTRASYFESIDSIENGINFFAFSYKDEEYLERFAFKKNLEFRIFDPYTSDEEVFWDPTNVSLEFLYDKTSFQIGFIRYRFSETFGLQILDVANPRDYSDFVLNDLSWAKRSVFGLNMQNQWERVEALWMLTLWPNGDRLPYRGSPFDLTGEQLNFEGGVVDQRWFEDYEYGARFKYLFESGFDLSFLAYHHFSRPTTLSLNILGLNQFQLKESRRQVNSLGFAGSFVVGDWVYRGDALYTADDTFQKGPLNFSTKDHVQFLVGADRVLERWMLGFQFQKDFAYDRNFLAAKAEYTFYERWKPAAMAFVGTENSDSWIQIKNSFELSSWKLEVTFDFIQGEENEKSLFGYYKDKDRVLVELTKYY